MYAVRDIILFMKLFTEEFALINKELSDIYVERPELQAALNEFLCNGSKRIRTYVVSLYLKACASVISPESIKIMAAGELIHNASLLHDDILDGAKTRRGKKTIGEKFSPNVSILTGDFLVASATEKLLEINNTEVLKIFLNCTKQMCNAELNQFFLRGIKPDLDDYLKICAGKTAALFEAVFESCAIIEGIDSAKAKSFALDFGILFQLKNDLDDFSAKADKVNDIYTPKDFLGIEKTMDLIDNYQGRLLAVIAKLPDNIYKKGLESLLAEL